MTFNERATCRKYSAWEQSDTHTERGLGLEGWVAVCLGLYKNDNEWDNGHYKIYEWAIDSCIWFIHQWIRVCQIQDYKVN
jgi:hypothetical protein